MTAKNQWFIVVGRLYGDDEATAHPIAAPDITAALRDYRALVRADAELPADPEPMDEEGTGYVYIDTVFACGLEQPREVWK